MLDVEELLRALHEAEVRFVIVGGMAAVVHGSSYVTADLDLCYARDSNNLERLAQALRPFQPRLRGAPEDLPFSLDAPTLRAGLNFTLTTKAGDLDLLGEITGLGGFGQVREHAEPITLYGYATWVLSLEGLIASKEASARPKDQRLLPELHALLQLRREEEQASDGNEEAPNQPK